LVKLLLYACHQGGERPKALPPTPPTPEEEARIRDIYGVGLYMGYAEDGFGNFVVRTGEEDDLPPYQNSSG